MLDVGYSYFICIGALLYQCQQNQVHSRTKPLGTWQTTAHQFPASRFISVCAAVQTINSSCCATGSYGRRAFSVADTVCWNSLPGDLRDTELGPDAFRHYLNTFLFLIVLVHSAHYHSAIYSVSQKNPLCGFLTFFPNGWEFFNQFYTPITRYFLH